MQLPPNTHIVRSPAQRRALTSPVRIEIVEHFACEGQATVREIAERMGRSPDSLYYHINLLRKVGLLIEAGTRKSGKRDERIYRLIGAQIALQCDPGSKASVQAVRDTVGAMLRLSERELDAALARRDIVEEGPGRTFYVRRHPARITRRALAEINRHIDAIDRIVEEQHKSLTPGNRARRVSVSITISTAPLESE